MLKALPYLPFKCAARVLLAYPVISKVQMPPGKKIGCELKSICLTCVGIAWNSATPKGVARPGVAGLMYEHSRPVEWAQAL